MLLGMCYFTAPKSLFLPDAQDMLHDEAHQRDGCPAAGTEQDGLASRSDELDDIAVEADGRHRHDDEEFRQLLEGREYLAAHPKLQADRREDCRQHEVQDKARKCPLETEGGQGAALRLRGLAAGNDKGEQHRHWNDGQCPRQFDSHSLVESLGAQPPHAVPGSRRSRDRGRIVDGRPRKNAKGLARRRVEAQQMAQYRKQQRSQRIEQEDDRHRLRHLVAIRLDDRCRRSDCRAAANGGPDADQRGRIARDPQHAHEHPGHHQRSRDGAYDNRQRKQPRLDDDAEVHPKAQQHHRRLQHHLGRPADAPLGAAMLFPDRGNQHAGQDSHDSTADHRKMLPKQPGWQRNKKTDKDTKRIILQECHDTPQKQARDFS